MPSSYTLKVCIDFCAAHDIRGYSGKCARTHGHNYRAEIEVKSQALNDIGLAIDSYEIKTISKNIIEQIDHRYLNEIEPFIQINPSAENIAAWIYKNIAKEINEKGVTLKAITLWETDDFCVRYEETE